MEIGSQGRGLRFSFVVDGEVQAAGFLLNMAGRVRDMRPVMPKWCKILTASVAQKFEGEGKPDFPWDDTVDQHHPILVRSGRMRDSFIEEGGEHIAKMEPNYLEFGSSVPYAIFHQSPRLPRKRLPRRPMLYINRKDVSQIVGALRKFIIKGEVD